MDDERILCAATWYEELTPGTDRIPNEMYLPKNIDKGLVFCGHRHSQCLYLKSAMTGLRDAECGTFIQGFLTNKNRFVDRIEGAKIAFYSGQIKSLKDNQRLYSEDLY